MSCNVCEEEPVTTYVRVGNGNVKVMGCVTHLKQLLAQNRVGMEVLKPKPAKELEA